MAEDKDKKAHPAAATPEPVHGQSDAVNLEADTIYVVGGANGEVEFKTDGQGRFTPTSEEEAWAVQQLGAKSGKGVSTHATE